MFALYRKFHGCNTALLSLTEQWRKKLDKHKIIGLVSMDFVERFRYIGYHMIWLFSNCENMELIGKQLILLTIAYRVSNNAWNSVTRFLPGSRSLKEFPTGHDWERYYSIFSWTTCIAQWSTPLFQPMLTTRKFSKPEMRLIWKLKRLLTQILVGYMDKWYEENEMRRNHQKYKVMVLRKTTENPVFKCASYCNRKRNWP